jgi:hypothetical protein
MLTGEGRVKAQRRTGGFQDRREGRRRNAVVGGEQEHPLHGLADSQPAGPVVAVAAEERKVGVRVGAGSQLMIRRDSELQDAQRTGLVEDSQGNALQRRSFDKRGQHAARHGVVDQ